MPDRRPFDHASPARAELDRLIADTLGFRLAPYLKGLARATVAAAMLSGCGMSHGEVDAGPPDGTDAGPPVSIDAGSPPPGTDAGPGVDAGAPNRALCSPEGQWLAVSGLNATRAPTWTGALAASAFRGPAALVHEVGERCGDAAAPASCQAEVDAELMNWASALITTEGDAVDRYQGPEQVAGYLGSIDTPNEAALMAWQAGYDIGCTEDMRSSVTEIAGGYRVVAYRQQGGCGSPWQTIRFALRVDRDGAIDEESSEVIREEEDWGCIGRRPAGLRAATPSRGTHPVGAFFANVTRLEASAVDAFDIMQDELAQLGAPAALREAARAAREDEVRHTASMAALARRYGAEPGTGAIDAPGRRSAFDIALENAVEGCVRETYGALVGAYQAEAARDPEIQAAMREVADDELRHAELSWALASWLEPRLSAEERARLAEAKREAVEGLRREAAQPHDRQLVDIAGLPSPEAAVALVDRLAADVWA